MQVKDIMIKKAVSVGPDENVTQVADIIFKKGFHGLPVLENGKLVGIITEDDFFLKGFDDLYLPSYIQFLKSNKVVDGLPANIRRKIKKLVGATAKDLMTSPCLSVTPSTPVAKLMGLIKKTKFTTWPVVGKNKKLVGIVTLVDVLGIFKGGGREMERAYEKQVEKTREVDLIAKDVQSFWGKTFVFINKTHIRTWKGVFFIAFISGAIAALFWTVSLRVQTKSGAQTRSAVLSLETRDKKIKVGDPFNVDVVLDGNEENKKVVSAVVDIKYDPHDFKLEIWDLDGSVFHGERGCIYGGIPCEQVEDNPERGEIRIKMAKPEGIRETSGKIANLVFRSLNLAFPKEPNIKIDAVSSGVYRNSKELVGYGTPENVLSETKDIMISAGGKNCAEGMLCTGM